LPFPEGTFGLVIALGVLPWLPAIATPLREIARVLRPGGSAILSVDTKWQLRRFFDPLLNPMLARPRKAISRLIRRRSPAPGVPSYVVPVREFRRALMAEGLEEQRGVALGFGPFTFCRREFLPTSFGLALQHWLQAAADRGAPALNLLGSQYLTVAIKARPPGANPILP
jgi:SAM-dependent methyltransferase